MRQTDCRRSSSAAAIAAILTALVVSSRPACAENYAGIFYFANYGDTAFVPAELAPTGDAWIMQQQSPWYSPGFSMNWWGKPYWAQTNGDGTIRNNYRFYWNGDPSQTNNALLDWHANLLANAGIDFVVLDFTNGANDFNPGPTYISATKALLNRWQARIAAGLPTPKVVFFALDGPTLSTIQSTFYKTYSPNCFFNYLGKPLALVAQPIDGLPGLASDPGQPAIPTGGIFDSFTCRHCWALDTTGSYWQFKENAVTPPAPFMYNGTPEEMCAPVACAGTSNGTALLPASQGRNNGAFFNTYMQAAQQVRPTFTFVHSWNEWNAANIGNSTTPEFIDQWLEPWSSDIEPEALNDSPNTSHGFQYYDLMAEQLGRLKNNFPVISGQTYTLCNENSGLMLDDPNGSTTPGTQLQQWPSNGLSPQAWTFTDLDDGYWTIVNAGNGLALDDYNWVTTPGAILDQWDNWGGVVQQWGLEPAGDGAYKIRNRDSNLCISIANASTAWGAKALLGNDNGGSDNNWFIAPYIAPGPYKIIATTSGNCLDTTSLNDGALAQLHPFAGDTNQVWDISYLDNGNFSIVNASNGRSLDCSGCSPNNGTLVDLWDFTNSACQQWTITPLGSGSYRISTANPKDDGVHDVLDGFGCSGNTGAQVELSTWDGGGCQQTWQLVSLTPAAPTGLTAQWVLPALPKAPRVRNDQQRFHA